MKKKNEPRFINEVEEAIIPRECYGLSKHGKDVTTETVLEFFDRCGAAARNIIENTNDKEYVEATMPVDGMNKHARVIPIDFNEDGIAVAGTPRQAIIFEGDAGGSTVGYVNDSTMGMLTDPVVIGTKGRPLGLFIPFTASTQTLVWAGTTFIDAAVNNYDRTNPNQHHLEISEF